MDNAALLNLDIAWCYLLLGSAAEIPDAAVRLDKCEQSLYKSYGPQMERLLTLKGTTGILFSCIVYILLLYKPTFLKVMKLYYFSACIYFKELLLFTKEKP